MAINEFTFDPGQILVPALPSSLNQISPCKFGASLTIAAGQACARKTSDGLMYALNLAATDGTQTFAGFSQYPLATDSSKNVYLVFSPTGAGSTYFSPPSAYANIWTGGVFNPNQLTTAATGAVGAEVDTLTPTNPTTGDIYTIGTTTETASFTVGGTQTAAAVVTGLTNSWNANPTLKALATPSGSGTFITTAVVKGVAMNLVAGVSGTGTTSNVITTAAVSAVTAEVDTFTPTNPTTGDVYTITITFPDLTTHAVSATVGATQTATAICNLLRTAWAADATAAAYAAATGTTTLILTALFPGTVTAIFPGSSMSLAGTVVGTGTVAKVVTVPVFGRNLSDILPGAPGARVLQPYGYWEIP
jgi:hypothetical protein